MFLFPYDTQICHLDFGNVMEIDKFVNVSSTPNSAFKYDLYSPSNEFQLRSTEANRITWQVGRMTEANFVNKNYK